MRIVVGAVLVDPPDAPTAVLAARRRAGPHAGAWEFPGGKVEPGETPAAALRRELHEELSLDVEVGQEVPAPGGGWPISDAFELRLFVVRLAAGVPGPGPDHDEVRWLTPEQLGDVTWLPSDEQALPAVRRLLGGLGGPAR